MTYFSFKNSRYACVAWGGVLIFGALLWSTFFKPGTSPQAAKAPERDNAALYLDPSIPTEARIEDLLNHMTLDEKIGQMTLVEKDSLKDVGDVSAYGIGAVLSGGGGKPDDNTPDSWKEMVARFTDASASTRLGIPLLYGADANHGNGNIPGATVFPHFIGLGAANDPALTESVARVTADESSALGIRWHFSPTLDLPRDIRWGRTYETFSDDPVRAGAQGAAYIRGIQNASSTGRIDALATAKHFVGLGSLSWGTSTNRDFHIDQGDVPNDDAALRQQYLPPYREAVDAGVLSVMAALGTWGGSDISANRYLLTDVLKGELGFRGFVVSDWYGVHGISWSGYRSTVAGINAGVDMVMLPYDYKAFASELREAVRRNDISQSRIDDAVRRILRAKFAMGLFDEPQAAPGIETVGSAEHRALARTAVQRSLVLLKNDADLLPLSGEPKLIRVAGSAADNVGRQSGGWTVEWQGTDGNWLPGSTSILAGIRATSGQHSTVEYEQQGNFTSGIIADVGIAVVGEKPYAEGAGDQPQPYLDAADLATIAKVRASSRKLVVVLVTGRPLIITRELPTWDALVVAWLPGSEGAGVADALFGASPFTGTLPLPWPRSIEQLPISTAGRTSDGSLPLFQRGFGIRP